MKSVNEQPLISIIVPVYKVEQYLNRCVESIVNQTYKNLEIILVDDGSPDNCPQMCDGWAKKDERIRVIHKENGGVSRARNLGIKEAKGDYISFVDSDDWVSPCFVEKLYDAVLKTGCDIVECEYQVCENECGENFDSNAEIKVYTTEEALCLNLQDVFFKDVVWNRIYRSEIVKTVDFVPDKRHEDVFWVYQVLAKSTKSAHICAPLYYYFQRGESFMNTEYSAGRLVGVDAAEERYEFINNNYPSLLPVAQMRFVGMCMYHSQKLLLFKIDGYKEYFKGLQEKAKKVGIKQVHDKKQKLWLLMYLKFPKLVCQFRNMLKIGI